jgi:hypothetical protein
MAFFRRFRSSLHCRCKCEYDEFHVHVIDAIVCSCFSELEIPPRSHILRIVKIDVNTVKSLDVVAIRRLRCLLDTV